MHEVDRPCPVVASWDATDVGDAWAPVYDRAHPVQTAEVPAAVAFLGRLVGPGPVVELGVGTGRLAIPLARAGHTVVGLDRSPGMLAVLRRKDPTGSVHLVRADLTAPPLAGPVGLAVMAFNTLFALPDAAAQASAFVAAAGMLGVHGRLVVDAAVPQPWRFPADGHDPAAQRVVATHRVEGRDLPLVVRYCWPDQMDQMAKAAGLLVERRVADWHGRPATDGADRLISVYRPGGPDARDALPDGPDHPR